MTEKNALLDFPHVAAPGEYRLVGHDTFDADSCDFHIADYGLLHEAVAEARARAAKHGGGGLTKYYVYDGAGREVFRTK